MILIKNNHKMMTMIMAKKIKTNNKRKITINLTFNLCPWQVHRKSLEFLSILRRNINNQKVMVIHMTPISKVTLKVY